MPLQLDKVHPYKALPGNRVQMGKENPVLIVKDRKIGRVDGRLEVIEDYPPIFIQAGQAYGAGGDKINRKDLPEWFWEYVNDRKKLSEAALAECGFDPTPPRKGGRPKKESNDGGDGSGTSQLGDEGGS